MSDYFKILMKPSARVQERRAWSIGVSTVWVPFFTAKRVDGTLDKTTMPDEALGAPERVRYAKDGSVRFTQSGRVSMETAKEIRTMVANIQDNFVAGLLEETRQVREAQPEDYSLQVQVQHEAGKPLYEADARKVAEALAAQSAAEQDEAERHTKPQDEAEAEPQPIRIAA